jgi:hypothetical protein
MSVDTAFTAGAIVGAVLIATVALVPLIRYVALVAATMAIAVVSIRGGVSELVDCVDAFQGLVGSAPTFSVGIIGGGLAVALIGLVSRRRRTAN